MRFLCSFDSAVRREPCAPLPAHHAWLILPVHPSCSFPGTPVLSHLTALLRGRAHVHRKDGESEGIIVAEMDPARLASVRGKMPMLSHRYRTLLRVLSPFGGNCVNTHTRTFSS